MSHIELKIPREPGYEKMAMHVAGELARMMGCTEERIEDVTHRGVGGVHQCHGARKRHGRRHQGVRRRDRRDTTAWPST